MENQNHGNKKKGYSVRGVIFLIALVVLVVSIVALINLNNKCERCHGDKYCQTCYIMGDRVPGVCWVCDGEGGFDGEIYVPCSSCEGTGICGTCWGSLKCNECGGSGKK